MAETAVAPPVTDGGHDRVLERPEERGTLEVRDRVVRRISELVALEVPRTLAREGLLGRLGGGSPAVDVDLRDGVARVTVRVDAVWPSPLATVAAEVRDAVLDRVPALAGVAVTTVDVQVQPVVPERDDEGRRVQ